MFKSVDGIPVFGQTTLTIYIRESGSPRSAHTEDTPERLFYGLRRLPGYLKPLVLGTKGEVADCRVIMHYGRIGLASIGLKYSQIIYLQAEAGTEPYIHQPTAFAGDIYAAQVALFHPDISADLRTDRILEYGAGWGP